MNAIADPIDTIITAVTVAEGSEYTNNPDDNGGPTKYGITLATLQEVQPGATADDVAALTLDQAKAIYHTRYVTAPHFDTIIALDPVLAAEVINWGVMAGQVVAAQALQTVCNVMNQRGTAYADITVDGKFGAGSQLALRQLFAYRGKTAAGAAAIRMAFRCLWGAFLIGLAVSNAKDEDFIYGWIAQRVNA